MSRSLRVGGYDLDDTVAHWLRHTHGLAIGESIAERVKLEVGSVFFDESNAISEVKGRDFVSGLLRKVDVIIMEMRRAL